METKRSQPRRSKGFGSITTRSDGRVVTCYNGKYYNGKYKYYKSYVEAKRALDKAVREGERQEEAPSKITVATYLQTYVERKALSVKPQSLDRIESTVNCQLIPRIGQKIKLKDFDAASYEHLVLAPMMAEELSYSNATTGSIIIYPSAKIT